MNINFSIADESKLEEIIKLCNEVFDEKTSYEEIKKSGYSFKENQIYLIGEYNGQIIAHTLITIIPTIFDGMETYAILNHVCVKEEYRQHKIATQMLEKVKRICEEKNCISIKLWSKNFRIPAHTCYQKFGFVKEEASFFSLAI